MGRLSNNQIYELALYEEMVRRLNELEREKGMERIHACWSEIHNIVTMTIPAMPKDRSGSRVLEVVSYTIFLDTRTTPLRVTWREGDGPAGVKSFGITRRCLRHIISQIQMDLYYQREDNAEQAEINIQIAAYEAGQREEWNKTHFCPCGHSYQDHDFDGDGPCHKCDCQEGGADVEEPQLHAVNLGGDPGGFMIYE